MRTGTRIGSMAAVLAVLALGGQASVDAQAPTPTMTVDPTTLTFGTTMTISGDGCVDPQTSDGTGLTVLVRGRSLRPANPQDPSGEMLAVVDVAPDGTWSVQYAVPDQAPNFAPTEDFSRHIRAQCGRVDPPTTYFDYPEVPVHFELPPPTSTTTTTAPPPPAPVPVDSRPSFTG